MSHRLIVSVLCVFAQETLRHGQQMLLSALKFSPVIQIYFYMLILSILTEFGLGIKQAGGWPGEAVHMDQQLKVAAVNNLLARGIQDLDLI